MRVNILLGRGIEGCGNTQCAIQMQKVTGGMIYAASDKKWGRSKGLEFDHELFNCSSVDTVNNLAKRLNETSDLVVVYSVPSKNGHPEACQNNFVDLVKQVNVRKILINVDHKSQSIARNARYKDICESVDVLMTHSLQNDFCKWAAKESVVTPIVKMGLGFDFDGHKAKYWKPIKEQQYNVIRWIGRSTGWKGPHIIMDFHEQELMDKGMITILEGLEASISYTSVLYRDDKNKTGRRAVMNYFRPEKHHNEFDKFSIELHGKEETGRGSYLYPPYINAECMQRMALSAFGSDMYHLKPELYGSNAENCHLEIVASGAVPIFHKHFCDNVIHTKQGVPISQCVNTGTIGLDGNNFAETRDLVLRLAADDGMRDEWRHMAFEFWKQHCDGPDVILDIVEQAFIDHQTKKSILTFY